MKTYLLEKVSSLDAARVALDGLLLRKESANNWTLRDADGDPIAYFSIRNGDVDTVGPSIIADMSGRHYHEDDVVIGVLKRAQAQVGGTISCAP